MLTTSEVSTSFGATKLTLSSFRLLHLLEFSQHFCWRLLHLLAAPGFSLRREFLVLLILYFSRVSFDVVHLRGGNGRRDYIFYLTIDMCMAITVD